MAFLVGKNLAVRWGPFAKSLDVILLEKTEELLKQMYRNDFINISHLDYKEIKSTKPNYRMFRIEKAYTHKDK